MENRKDIETLRRRAQWYRDFAAIGSEDNKAIRLLLAQNFERMADEREKLNSSNAPEVTAQG